VAVYVEDALVVLAIGALFVLTVFFRDRWWAQACLGGVFVIMAVVLVRRLRRVHKAFTGQDDGF